jgi:hypothetical protein
MQGGTTHQIALGDALELGLLDDARGERAHALANLHARHVLRRVRHPDAVRGVDGQMRVLHQHLCEGDGRRGLEVCGSGAGSV